MKWLNPPAEQTFDSGLQRTCKTCGHSFSGRYCNRCGEKVIEPSERSVFHIVRRTVNGFIKLDNAFIRTVRLMAASPGELSKKFMEGIRTPYIRPVSVFLLVNIVYFMLPGVDNTFNTHLRTQMHFLPHSSLALKMVQERMAEEQTTLREFTIRYQQQSTNMAKLLLIVYALLTVPVLAAIHYSSRFYLSDQLFISFEFNALMILLSQVLLPWVLVVVDYMLDSVGLTLVPVLSDTFFTILTAIISLALLYVFEKRVYRQEKNTAWIKAGLMLCALFICLQIYRMFLFFVTMWTL
jgi:hypothetical protein